MQKILESVSHFVKYCLFWEVLIISYFFNVEKYCMQMINSHSECGIH